MKTKLDVKNFWNERASLGEAAGSNDLLAKEIEVKALKSLMPKSGKVLELGCGNGETAIRLATELKLNIDAYDYSEKMISAATQLLSKSPTVAGQINFQVADICDIRSIPDLYYDAAYTERALINLQTFEEQVGAIQDITKKLKPGGCYFMCENSYDGLSEINSLRSLCDLSQIEPPWHNLYMNEKEIAELHIKGVELIAVHNISATYQFLSRVVNAWLAKINSQQLSYDADINKLALLLPPIGNFGQTKIWVFKKIFN
jgi:ubiquinone/menaquinone biosynthesis C-methylase UbiE